MVLPFPWSLPASCLDAFQAFANCTDYLITPLMISCFQITSPLCTLAAESATSRTRVVTPRTSPPSSSTAGSGPAPATRASPRPTDPRPGRLSGAPPGSKCPLLSKRIWHLSDMILLEQIFFLFVTGKFSRICLSIFHPCP